MDNSPITGPAAAAKPNRRTAALVWPCAAAALIALAAIIYFAFGRSPAVGQNSAPKLCGGVNVVFFPGGNETDTFAKVVYAGARQAQSDLGANVSYVWSDWDSQKMTSQFKDAIAKLPDAIAMMGHPGAAALGPLIDEAEKDKIIVTLQNVDIPDVRAKFASNGFGYVGQNLYNSGLTVADGAAREFQPAKGADAIVFGVDPKADPARYERTKGVVDGLKKAGLNVHEITITAEVQANASSDAAVALFSKALSEYPAAKIIVIDHGALTAAAPGILRQLGKRPSDMNVAGFDLSAATVTGIKSGYISLILDQQPYLQGYLPILQTCLTKKYGFAGLYVDTGVGLIDRNNVDAVADLAEKGIR